MEPAPLENLTEGQDIWGQEPHQASTQATTLGMDSSILLKAPLELGTHPLAPHKAAHTEAPRQEGGQHPP